MSIICSRVQFAIDSALSASAVGRVWGLQARRHYLGTYKIAVMVNGATIHLGEVVAAG